MKMLLFLTALLLTLSSCELNLLQTSDNGPAVVPDGSARIARTYSLGGPDNKTVLSEIRYVYGANGLLERVDRFSRNANGSLDRYAYEMYTYTDNRQVQSRVEYSRTSQTGDFKPNTTRQYTYPSPDKTVETMLYADYQTGALKPQARTETVRQNNLPVTSAFFSLYGTSPNEPSQITTYQYENGRLIKEETRSGTGTAFRSMVYTYKGRTARVDEFIPQSKESISEQKRTYDARGRLVQEEVVRTNPLLCFGMFVGVTVHEYLD
ncbi:hypothetical protein F5984_05765 [Rudanella paleaurantiibacter]|uniref:DUF4595 domain-containing protein n=1 Tax=Rudanella paleaurantiibacter TaxID=2614655 RepID=A0A7J5U2C7_9BACT|nr:hypothetical protein [Rudanella paleaurantiibacter]KAB7731732.1 hypothetical protein F5984_05765 [Rudanella paleaurantiibacter]